MRETLKKLIRLTAGYSLISFLGPALTLILTPLYTRVLDPADYGVIDISLTLATIISLFVLLGLDQALSAHFFSVSEDERGDLVISALVYTLGIGFVFAGGMIVFSGQLAQVLFEDTSRSITLIVLALQICAAPTYAVIAASFRLGMKVRSVNILGLVNVLSLAVLNICMVLVFHAKATGVVAANAIANAITAAIGLWMVLRARKGRFRIDLLRKIWRTGLAIVPGITGFIFLSNFDRLMLTQYVSQTDIGLYSLANKLASIVFVIINTAWVAWWPIALDLFSKPDASRQYARMFEYFLCASMLLSLGIGLFSPEILRTFTRQEYVGAASYSLWLMVYTGPIAIASSAFQTGIYARNKVKLSSIAFLLSAAVNIALNLVLMPIYGVMGAVWATLIGGIFLIVVLFVLGQNVFLVPYRIERILPLLVCYFTLVTLCAANDLQKISFLARFLGLAVFFALINIFGFLRFDQYRALLGYAMRKRIRS